MYTAIALIFGGLLFLGFHVFIWFDKTEDTSYDDNEFVSRVAVVDFSITVILIIIGAIFNSPAVLWGFLMLVISSLTLASYFAEMGIFPFIDSYIKEVEEGEKI